MAANTDLFRKKKSQFSTTLASALGSGDSSASLSSASGLPTDTAITLTVDRVDANGVSTPSAQERITGVISGTTLGSLLRGEDGGSAKAHSSGAIVEDIWEAESWNDALTALLVDHTQAGAHKFSQVLDANSNETLKLASVASAVNEITLTNAATGNPALISATGGDTNINIKLVPKGTAGVYIASAWLDFDEISAPSSPAANIARLYAKDSSGTTKLYYKDSAGTETEISSGGGAGGYNQVLDWSNVILPDTNFPSLGKTVGTNWAYKTLDFDASTDEACYWNVNIPTNLTPTAAKLILYWTAAAGTAAQAAYWQATTRMPDDDEVIDATSTPSSTTDAGNDALIATGDLHVLEITLTITGWAAGDMIQIKLNRDADNGSDNLAADAKLIAAVIQIT